MTPDQYRRDGAEAILQIVEAEVRRVLQDMVTRGVSREKFPDAPHVAIRAIDVDAVLAGLPPAFTVMENGECQVSIEPATGATTNGPRGWDADAPVAGDNNHPDPITLMLEAANQARLALAGYVTAESAIDMLDAALAAMEADHD